MNLYRMAGWSIFAIVLGAVLSPSQTPAQSHLFRALDRLPAGDQDSIQNKAAAAGFKLEPCNLPPLGDGALCGKFEVYENRETKTGRKLGLSVVVLPSTAAKPAPDALFVFEGGPGAGAADRAKSGFRKAFYAKIRKERAVVLVDQRGTGSSNRLDCSVYAEKNDMASYFAPPFSVERVRACVQNLGQTADLSLYTSSIAMDDIDDIRAALGYDRIDLYGASYGSTAALVYLHRHGDHVRAAAIEAVCPPDYKLPLPFSKTVQAALQRTLDDCAANPRCNGAFPNLKSELDDVIGKLDKEPASVTTGNPLTGQRVDLKMTRFGFVEGMRLLLYDPQTAGLVPMFIHQAHNGDFAQFSVFSYLALSGVSRILAGGMSLSVLCAEDVPFITDKEAQTETAGTYYGDFRLKRAIEACKEWPRGKIPADFRDPIKSNSPILILSGDMDPVTPPAVAARLVPNLPNSRQIVGHNWGHGAVSECAEELVSKFLTDGSAKSLDAGCVERSRRPPFSIGFFAEIPTADSRLTKTSWAGALKTGAASLRLVLNVYKSADGKIMAALDSPDQGLSNLAVDEVTVGDGQMHFEMTALQAAFDGKLAGDGKEANGFWKQGGAQIPVTFKQEAN